MELTADVLIASQIVLWCAILLLAGAVFCIKPTSGSIV